MKKYLCIVVLSILLPLFIGQCLAGNISPTNKTKVDQVMSVVELQKSKESIASQLARYEKTVKIFSKLSMPEGDQKEIISYLLECFQTKIKSLKSQLKTQNDVIGNVDWDRVKQERLAWHNYERSQKGLSPYTYNESLDYTALTWAEQIANEQRKTGSTHVRKLGDGYRNTNSIKEWFANMGVNVVSFSESNAYGYYSCSKSDCTQEMIDILKKCFNRTYLNSTHYPAIVSNTYDQIGLGVATNGNYVRITTHYGADVK